MITKYAHKLFHLCAYPKNNTNARRRCQFGALLIISFLFVATAIAAPGQTFTTLFSFDGANGAEPSAPLVQATDGDFYGTTAGGGAAFEGTVFKITPQGTLTVLYSFCAQPHCADGASPTTALIQATNGNFYGTTVYGGIGCAPPPDIPGCGTVFRMDPDGSLTTLHLWSGDPSLAADEAYALVQATDGDFYGTTVSGGTDYAGSVFRMTPSGALTTLFSFVGPPQGYGPEAGLIQATDGNLYGTTLQGGDRSGPCAISAGCGTVFRMDPDGSLTTLHTFHYTDGGGPGASLLQGNDGNFYGTTIGGGAHGAGTAFTMTPAGKVTTLYSFCAQENCVDGAYPEAALTQATDGNFYGTAVSGGKNHDCCGTAFRITPKGTLTTLHSFSGANIQYPFGLVQGTDGNLYGTTANGGTSTNCGTGGCGTVYSIKVGLGPFVKAQVNSGIVGARCAARYGSRDLRVGIHPEARCQDAVKMCMDRARKARAGNDHAGADRTRFLQVKIFRIRSPLVNSISHIPYELNVAWSWLWG